jgi:selenocysteine-specific elongation factor
LSQIILGTAGHIDHGKTSLIRKVTGIDTDRLKEEKARGITIELGFASLALPNGETIGIVDVPGHEKFVKNMVAGATGIDIVAMVIAADEGVMPQTREHMEICTLLGVQHGVVVMTKIDLVDEEMLELAQEDIKDFTRGTFLDGAPILAVSSVTGDGIESFTQTISDLVKDITPRPASGIFRLPVDRVFSMKGFGTVITGTLISGSVKVGDPVMLFPSAITSKVRGIQVHNQTTEKALSGQRTAVNFQGLEKAAVNRGKVLSSPNALFPSYMIDLSFHYLKSNPKPIKNRTRVRFHSGTSEIMGNIILLENEEMKPGEEGVVQIRLESPVALIKDDRYVIRSYSPVRTIGGGYVLNPVPGKHKRFKPEVTEGLKKIDQLDEEALVGYYVDASALQGISFAQLKITTNITGKHLEKAVSALLSRKELIQIDKDLRVFLHQNRFQKIEKEISAYLDQYHRKHPLKAGMPREELKSKFPVSVGTKIFTLVINEMIKQKTIMAEAETVRLPDHSVSLGADQTDIRKKIVRTYQQSGLTPPYFRELAKSLGQDPKHTKDVLTLLIDEGLIVKTKDDLYFHKEAIAELQGRLVDFLKANGEIATPQFKEMIGASRKYVIPLMEYFDSQNVTIRIGDIRKLRKS